MGGCVAVKDVLSNRYIETPIFFRGTFLVDSDMAIRRDIRIGSRLVENLACRDHGRVLHEIGGLDLWQANQDESSTFRSLD